MSKCDLAVIIYFCKETDMLFGSVSKFLWKLFRMRLSSMTMGVRFKVGVSKSAGKGFFNQSNTVL